MEYQKIDHLSCCKPKMVPCIDFSSINNVKYYEMPCLHQTVRFQYKFKFYKFDIPECVIEALKIRSQRWSPSVSLLWLDFFSDKHGFEVYTENNRNNHSYYVSECPTKIIEWMDSQRYTIHDLDDLFTFDLDSWFEEVGDDSNRNIDSLIRFFDIRIKGNYDRWWYNSESYKVKNKVLKNQLLNNNIQLLTNKFKDQIWKHQSTTSR